MICRDIKQPVKGAFMDNNRESVEQNELNGDYFFLFRLITIILKLNLTII